MISKCWIKLKKSESQNNRALTMWSNCGHNLSPDSDSPLMKASHISEPHYIWIFNKQKVCKQVLSSSLSPYWKLILYSIVLVPKMSLLNSINKWKMYGCWRLGLSLAVDRPLNKHKHMEDASHNVVVWLNIDFKDAFVCFFVFCFWDLEKCGWVEQQKWTRNTITLI